jgi:UDP-GlcNAc:undecaprenyl-phosphate GlcNAc-1-phosphate transferase
MQSILLLIAVLGVSVTATLLVKKAAIYFKILDFPAETQDKKVHLSPTPLLGGTAIAVSFFVGIVLIYLFQPSFITHISLRQLEVVFVASLLLLLGGFLDDKYNLSPWKQLVLPVLAVLLVVAVGVNLKEITNPFGGKFNLLAVVYGQRFIWVDLLAFVWIFGMMYSTKLLDGLDGLVSGLTVIGSVIIGFLCLTEKFYQADIALVAFVFAAANLGFLIFNFYPAKIFLGEGGSLFTGFILGYLAIAAGGKIATALLVMGIAVIDVISVVMRRLNKKTPFFVGDAGHLHHRFLRAGFSKRQTVLIFYCLAMIFGVLTLFLQSREKLFALLVLAALIILLSVGIDLRIKKYEAK